jgi:xylulokinase
MCLVGVDVGSTGCKAVAVSLDGVVHGYAYREYPTLSPRPGWLECDPHVLWRSVRDVLSEIAPVGKVDPISAIGISTSGDDIILVDGSFNPLCNTPVSMDSRGSELREWWASNIGEERAYQITGLVFHAMHSIIKAMWFREHMPDIFNQAKKILCWHDFILAKLTGKPILDYSMASRTMAFDIRKKKWSDGILSEVGISPDMLGIPLPAGEPVGTIDPGVAREIGISPEVAVVVGGIDQACSALGAGSTRAGAATVCTGTVECLMVASAEPKLTPQMFEDGYPFGCHVVRDLFAVTAGIFGAGSILKWYRDTLGAEEKEIARKTGKDVYSVIVDQAQDHPADVYLLPHFSGVRTPWQDPYSRGAILGLTLSTGRAELIRGMLDSITYELKLNINRLEDAGVLIERIGAAGGGAKSRRWLQIKADITGKEIVSYELTEAGCLGAAMLAGVGVGVYRSEEEAAERLVKPMEIFRPEASEHRVYEEKYELYSRIYPTLSRLNRLIAGIS